MALYVKVGGYVDLATATAAWYVAVANVINDAFGGTVSRWSAWVKELQTCIGLQ